MTPQTFAFDVYGTLIDTEGVLQVLEDFLGNRAQEFSTLWRNKQLEYSFRRGLMDKHVDFSVCTREALQYTGEALDVSLSDAQKDELMDAYKTLPAFDDVKSCLQELRAQGHRIYAFSNGSLQAIQQLLNHAALTPLFDGSVSMATIASFKPNPKGYQHFNDATASEKINSWLVSGNTFDVIGAAAYGMRTIWLKRSANRIFDPMGFAPDGTVSSLNELPKRLQTLLISEQ